MIKSYVALLYISVAITDLVSKFQSFCCDFKFIIRPLLLHIGIISPTDLKEKIYLFYLMLHSIQHVDAT